MICPLCWEQENVVTHLIRNLGEWCNRVAEADRWSDKVMRQRWLTLSQLGEVHLQKMQIGWTGPWPAPRQPQSDEWTCVWNKRNRIKRWTADDNLTRLISQRHINIVRSGKINILSISFQQIKPEELSFTSSNFTGHVKHQNFTRQ